MSKYLSKDAIDYRIYVYLLLFAFGNVLSVAAGNIFLVLTALGLIHRVVRYGAGVREIFSQDKTFWRLLAILLLVMLVSTVNAVEPLRGLNKWFDVVAYRMLPLYAVIICVREKKRLLLIGASFFAAMFVNDIYTIVQGVEALPQFKRSAGVMFFMHQATMLAILLPAAVVIYLAAVSARIRCACVIFGVTALGALVFNATRGAWLGTVISLIIISLLQVGSKRKLLACFVALGIVLGGVYAYIPGFQQRIHSIGSMADNSHRERSLIWHSAVNMAKDHPLLGVGYGQFKKNYQEKYISPEAREPYLEHAHSNVMNYLAECGVLGLAALLAFWGYLTYYALHGWRRYRGEGYLLLLALILGIWLHGLTEYNMGASITMKFCWLCLGLCMQWNYLTIMRN